MRLLLILNLACVLPALLALLAPYVSSSGWWIPSVVALAAPYTLILPLLWAIGWGWGKKWLWLAVNAGILLMGWSILRATLQYNGAGGTSRYDIRVVSVNVNAFGYRHRNFEKTVTFLQQQKPDLVCLQEFYEHQLLKPSYFQRMKKALGFKYHEFVEIFPGKRFGFLFLSRFPIKDAGPVTEVKKHTRNGVAFAEIELYGQRVRIYNLHLESYRLSTAQRKALYTTVANSDDDAPRRRKRKRKTEAASDAPADPYPEKPLAKEPDVAPDERLWPLIKTMLKVWKVQENQVALYRDHLGTWQGKPVIVCGDLNNPPYNYLYRQVKGDLQDAYMVKGSGFGRTYGTGLKALRIDYIFASRQLLVQEYRTLDTGGISDHKAIYARLRFSFHN